MFRKDFFDKSVITQNIKPLQKPMKFTMNEVFYLQIIFMVEILIVLPKL